MRTSKKNFNRGEDESKTKRQDGGEVNECVGMHGRDEPQRVGGRERRLTEGAPEDDTAEGGRAPSQTPDQRQT